jgi:hypothetical protein
MHRIILPIPVLLLAGCLFGPLDILGRETIVTEQEELKKEETLEDDRIEDKKLQYDPDLTVTETFDNCEIVLNKSGSVTRLDILPFDEKDAHLDGKLFRGRAEALAGLPAGADTIPSMEVVNGHLKPFNDGTYAAVEMALQDGSAAVPVAKKTFLLDLLAALQAKLAVATPSQQPPVEDAIVFVAAGLLAGGESIDVGAKLTARAEAEVDSASALILRPIGFYTWNDTLEGIFSQDRMLQNQAPGRSANTKKQVGLFGAIAVVLAEDPDLRSRYQSILALYSGLTNPFVSYTPERIIPYVDGLATLDDLDALRTRISNDLPQPSPCTRAFWALFPASRSKDTAYFNSRWCGTPVPAQVSFIDELIAAIRHGEVDLEPGADSGWYDYQLWALETLLLPERGPESDHLLLTSAYKKKLIETFESLITQARETHVKQLAVACGLSEPGLETEVYPKFPVEPFPTFYLRTARGYRLLATVLAGVLGSAFLEQEHRLHANGSHSSANLRQELAAVTELAYGLYFLSAASVGLRAETYLLGDELTEVDVTAAETRARAWLSSWRSDPDLLADPRVIVPVGMDNSKVIYWATVGVKLLKVKAEFLPGYEPEVVSGMCDVKGFRSHETFLLSEQTVEVHLSHDVPPPTRDELRALCDQYDDADSIVAALERL